MKVCINDLQYEDIAASEAPSPPPSLVTTNNYMLALSDAVAPRFVDTAAIMTATNVAANDDGTAIAHAAVNDCAAVAHEESDATVDAAMSATDPDTHLDPPAQSSAPSDVTHDSCYESMDISSCTTSSGPDTAVEGQEHLFLKPLPPPPKVKINLPVIVQVRNI